MLRRILVNKKTIPVPVPIQTLAEAVSWVESTLLKNGSVITRISLNKEVQDETVAYQAAGKRSLSDADVLEIQIDTAEDLAIQTLDILRNLASVVLDCLKPLAVDAWQAMPQIKPKKLDATREDMQLIIDLAGHLKELLSSDVAEESSVFFYIVNKIEQQQGALNLAGAHSDWRGLAKVLLNKVEPLFKELKLEAENLEDRLLDINNRNYEIKHAFTRLG